MADNGRVVIPRFRQGESRRRAAASRAQPNSAELAPDRALPAVEALAPPWPGRKVRLDGSMIYVRDTPATVANRAPALYVHGLGGSSTNWTDLAGLLAGHVDGCAIDLPGWGRSDPADRYTLAAFADRVVRWIDRSGRGPVHLLGNSLGGTVSVKVAATRPDLIRTLTLISPALPFLDPRRSLQSRVVPLLVLPRADRLARRLIATVSPDELASRVVQACFADPGRMVEQRLAEAVEEIRLRYTLEHYPSAYVRTLRGLVASFLRAYLPGDGSLWRTVAAVRAPTLVVGGRQDRLVDVRVGPLAAGLIQDSRLLMLDGVGHVAHMEVPRLVARAVVGMLENGSGSSDVAD
jgi:pimeloyl-ACP methyl ester carboxylesterase